MEVLLTQKVYNEIESQIFDIVPGAVPLCGTWTGPYPVAHRQLLQHVTLAGKPTSCESERVCCTHLPVSSYIFHSGL
jgi:hypothetical protein